MIPTPIDPSAVQAGDYVHFDTPGCPGDRFVKVLAAPTGKNYVSVELLGCPRWIHRLDIRSAIRPVGLAPADARGPFIDLPGHSGQPTGTTT